MTDKVTMKQLLFRHYELYPRMRIQDLVKLIYQNEFAGGHFIVNEMDSLKRLQDECRSLRNPCGEKSPVVTMFEDIGNGLCRYYLYTANCSDIEISTVNRLFVNTANSAKGSLSGFEDKLDVLRQCCKDGDLPFDIKELEEYLLLYQRQGYPPVSHSKEYRSEYHPAYRIIRTEYRDFFEVFCRIDSLLKSKAAVNVAIDGNSGSGKSTLASLISNVYNCNVFHMDHYFLRPELKTVERLKETGGNVDYVRFRQEIIGGLQTGDGFEYRIYDCKESRLGKPITVIPKRLNIIEGSYSMRPDLADNYDLKIFLHIDEDIQRQRILKRNGPFMLERFLSEWIPMENKYFTELKIKEKSDLAFMT